MNPVKTFDFKISPIEIEVKDLKFVRELPKLLARPHKATFYQLIWITKGEARFRIDFREIPICANEILIISAGQVCEFDISSDYSGKNILFTGSFFMVTELDSDFLHTSQLLNPVELNRTFSISPQRMERMVLLLEEEMKQPAGPFQTGIAQSYLRIILLEAERQLAISHVPVVDSIARKFYTSVEEHFKENKNVEYYVNLLGINEKKLYKEIKILSGKTPKVYIDSRTILEAKRLLSYSSLTVKEISYELGFDEPTNFIKYFRKHTTITPMKFRGTIKNIRSDEDLPL